MFDYSEKLQFFKQNGYVIFNSAIETSLVDSFWADVEHNLRYNPDLTMTQYGKVLKNSERQGDLIDEVVLRIIDIEKHSIISPRLILNPVVQEFLGRYYNGAPSAIQTLTYKFSSEQAAHSDLFLVDPGSIDATYDRSKLAAAWIACEDSNEDNGALVIYPGSHLLPKKTLRDDFGDHYGNYVAYLENLCAENGIKPKVFEAKKGDVLFWHGDFVHAGGPIRVPGKTRKSLVVHYSKLHQDSRPRDQTLTRHAYQNGWYFK